MFGDAIVGHARKTKGAAYGVRGEAAQQVSGEGASAGRSHAPQCIVTTSESSVASTLSYGLGTDSIRPSSSSTYVSRDGSFHAIATTQIAVNLTSLPCGSRP